MSNRTVTIHFVCSPESPYLNTHALWMSLDRDELAAVARDMAAITGQSTHELESGIARFIATSPGPVSHIMATIRAAIARAGVASDDTTDHGRSDGDPPRNR